MKVDMTGFHMMQKECKSREGYTTSVLGVFVFGVPGNECAVGREVTRREFWLARHAKLEQLRWLLHHP